MKGLTRKPKMGNDHMCVLEENLRFNILYYLGTVNFNTYMYLVNHSSAAEVTIEPMMPLGE